MHVRQCAAERAHGAGEHARQRRRGGEAQPQRADLAAGGTLGGLDRTRGLRQRGARLDQKQRAGFGELDLAPIAVEQRNPELALDRLDL